MKHKSLVIAICALLLLIATAAYVLRAPQQVPKQARSPAASVFDPEMSPHGAQPPASTASSEIRFEVVAVGIDFRYRNSADPATPGARMFEFTGGGVGAADFDIDGRPDLYFTQGCRWPPDPSQRDDLDRLYRNLGDRYIDVTDAAEIVEPGFSQGVACGDYNEDGFPDVYVGNIGANRLFRNNGDGTFGPAFPETSTSTAGDEPQQLIWTTSVAIADLNGDSLPDLFDANYVTGPDVFERICDHDGTPRVCSPTVFTAERDGFWLNRGDGTFSEVGQLAGLVASAGTGLGVLAADFDGSGRLGLFVANDARPNHFFRNVTASAGELPRFEENAAASGLATDAAGSSQACMGIAAGDANGDGRLDLFVTNYVDESNTLYEQEVAGTFTDATRRAGLAEPSRHLLGFGTQFLDADNDGWEDLVVANGHVDDFRFKGYAFEMPAQFFKNAEGVFQEEPASSLGSYFQNKHFGRGLARVDWNGDGCDECVVSHLGEPAVLLTNVGANAGKSISLRFRATKSARDATGTVVTVATDRRRLVRQLTAGDGYQASNERKLVIGLGRSDHVDSVTVRWPSGRSEQFEDLAAGGSWLMIEGRNRPFRVSH